jgi:hypothetical protein
MTSLDTIYACLYCGALKCSFSGTGRDIECCGEVGQVEPVEDPVTVEFHDTPQLWIAYRGCGCADCIKGIGKTQEEAISDLREHEEIKRDRRGSLGTGTTTEGRG